MATPRPVDLELIDTKDLLAELVKRFDGVVFCGINDTTPHQWCSNTKLEGNAITCLAAGQILQARLAEKINREESKP